MDNLDIKAVITASMYFSELFKKTILASSPMHTLTRTQMDLLMSLHFNGPMNMSALSEQVGIAPEQAARAMKSLREQGLAESARSEENRRMVIARISDSGTLLMDEHVRSVEEDLRASLEGLSPDEMELLCRQARSIVELLRKTGLKHVVVDPEASRQ